MTITKPTPAQAEAGNYRKQHIRLHGLDIAIETPKGRSRKPGWPLMACDYGYIKRTAGADGDHVDVMIGPDKASELVVVVDQVSHSGKFDEHKCLIGFRDTKTAVGTYKRCYTAGWKVGPVTTMTMQQFKNWLEGGSQMKPIGKQVSKYAASETTGNHGDKGRFVTTDDGNQIFITSSGTINRTGKPAGGKPAKESKPQSKTPKTDWDQRLKALAKRRREPLAVVGQPQPQRNPNLPSFPTSSKQSPDNRSRAVNDFASSTMQKIKAAEADNDEGDDSAHDPRNHPLHHSQLASQFEQALLNWNNRAEEITAPIQIAGQGASWGGGDRVKPAKNAEYQNRKPQIDSHLDALDQLIAETKAKHGIDMTAFIKHNNLIPKNIAAKMDQSDPLINPVDPKDLYAAMFANAFQQAFIERYAVEFDESKHPRDEQGRFTAGRRAPKKLLAELRTSYSGMHQRFREKMDARREKVEADYDRMRSAAEDEFVSLRDEVEAETRKRIETIEKGLESRIKQIEAKFDANPTEAMAIWARNAEHNLQEIADSHKQDAEAKAEKAISQAEKKLDSTLEKLEAKFDRLRDKIDQQEQEGTEKLDDKHGDLINETDDARFAENDDIESHYNELMDSLDADADDYEEQYQRLDDEMKSLTSAVDKFYDELLAKLTDFRLAQPEQYAARKHNTQPGQLGMFGDGLGGKMLRAPEVQRKFDWDEAKHPRDADGKFTSGAGEAKKPEPPTVPKPEELTEEEKKRRRDFWNNFKPEGNAEAESESKSDEPKDKPASDSLFGDDPRDAADRRQKELDADYEFARKSAIGNAGEDLKGSARHKRNEWRSLEDAEKNGTAAELVTRDNLIKNEPHDLGAHIDRNPLTAIFLHQAIKTFPPTPGYGKSTDDDPAKTRSEYVEAYRSFKSKAESILKSGADIKDAQKSLTLHLDGIVKGLRSGSYLNRYNRTANGLVGLLNNLSRGKILAKVASSVVEFKGKAGEMSPEDLKDKLSTAAATFMEGGSLDAALGQVKSVERGDKFNPAEMYVGHAERKGGPKSRVTTAKDATAWMVDKVGIRGVQFGNSVSDKEREHHAKMTADALLDLADVTGLPLEGISLDGKLGLAIGARGVGGALAHYEPGSKVINLTRKNGVGSLAHEWGHAFDHSMNGFGKFMSDDTDTHEVSVDGSRGWKTTTSTPDRFKGNGSYKVSERPSSAVRKAMADLQKSQSSYRTRLRGELQDRVSKKQMSQKKADKYWDTDIEIFARTFERFVQHKLESSGRKNSYLSGIETKAYKSGGLWPTDDEVKAMTPAFDALMDAHRVHNLNIKDRVMYSASQRADIHAQIVELYAAKRAKPQEGQQEFTWITVHPNDGPGRPVMIDKKDGTIKAGMGGKFNGQKIGSLNKDSGDKKSSSGDKASSSGDKKESKLFSLGGDTAVVNLPLDKRGNGSLNSQIDRWKKQEAQEKKAKDNDRRHDFNAAKSEAKKLFELHGESLVQSTHKKHGGKISEIRSTLDSMVKWEPQKALKIISSHAEKNAVNEPASTAPALNAEHPKHGSISTRSNASDNADDIKELSGFIDNHLNVSRTNEEKSRAIRFLFKDQNPEVSEAIAQHIYDSDPAVYDSIRTDNEANRKRPTFIEALSKDRSIKTPTPSPAKPVAPSPSAAPPTIPGEQTSLFGGDDMNSGQKSLFNFARPSKADIRAAKQQTAPPPASLLEQIDDEEKNRAESRKSLPGQQSLYGAFDRHAAIIEYYRASAPGKPAKGNPHGKKGDKPETTTGTFGDKGRFVTLDGRVIFIESKESVAAKRKKRDDAKAPFQPKTVLDHAIVEYIGNHKRMVEAFKPFIEDAHKMLNNENGETMHALRDTLSAFGYSGKKASAFLSNLRHKRDYTNIRGFDEMAEYAKKYHPQLLAGRTGESSGSGDFEQQFFERLKQGFEAGYAKHSPEVLELASQMAGSGFFDESQWDYDPGQVDDVPFDAYRFSSVERYAAMFTAAFSQSLQVQ